MDSRIEKRHHRRKKQNTMVALESLEFGMDYNTRMLNCSDDGIYFESNQFLPPGTERQNPINVIMPKFFGARS
jgi:hypothetical protein